MPSAGSFFARESTHATIAEPGKRCNQCQARETMQSVRSAGKPLIRVENWSFASAESMPPVPNAGKHVKHVTFARCEKVRVNQVTI